MEAQPGSLRGVKRLAPGAMVLILGGAAFSTGCQPKQAATNVPEPTAETSEQSAAEGLRIRYPTEARTLAQTTTMSFSAQGGGQFAAVNAKFTAQAQLAGEGESLKHNWSIGDIEQWELKGAAITDKDGDNTAAPPWLAGIAGAWIIDNRGEVDEKKSLALPENQNRWAELKDVNPQTAQMQLSYLLPALQMPPLPEIDLPVGKEVTRKTEEKANLGGLEIPVEKETTYHLLSVDDSSGERIAKVQVTVDESGDKEMQGKNVVWSRTVEGTLHYNLDAQYAVGMKVVQEQSVAMGPMEQTVSVTLDSTFSLVPQS